MPSILDAIDAFLTTREDKDFSTVPGREIEKFGERVREFTAAYTPEVDETKHPIYLGGWPSANFALIGGDLILSSLLYSGQVLVRDPIADWFSEEQYHNEHLISASSGFRPDQEDPESRTARTRAFLSTVIPLLIRMRPLIDAGIILPVATEPVFLQKKRQIENLRKEIREQIPLTPIQYANRFAASEIAAENNVRGQFVMASGPDPSSQVDRAIDHGVRYFAREYTLASLHGVTYTAPFSHEKFLCRDGISPIASSSNRVVEAVLRSTLPVFHGLTPTVVREIHDDDAFAAFRATLHQVYQGTPTANPAETDRYIQDQESALLLPLIAQGEKAASGGFLSRLSATLTDNKYGIVAALAADLMAGTGGGTAAAGVAGVVLDELARRRQESAAPQRIWSALVKHGRTAVQEVTSAPTMGTAEDDSLWGIPTTANRSVVITPGQMILDADPRTLLFPEMDEDTRNRLGVYAPCRCGSGRKFRFCCAGLR